MTRSSSSHLLRGPPSLANLGAAHVSGSDSSFRRGELHRVFRRDLHLGTLLGWRVQAHAPPLRAAALFALVVRATVHSVLFGVAVAAEPRGGAAVAAGALAFCTLWNATALYNIAHSAALYRDDAIFVITSQFASSMEHLKATRARASRWPCVVSACVSATCFVGLAAAAMEDGASGSLEREAVGARAVAYLVMRSSMPRAARVLLALVHAAAAFEWLHSSARFGLICALLACRLGRLRARLWEGAVSFAETIHEHQQLAVLVKHANATFIAFLSLRFLAAAAATCAFFVFAFLVDAAQRDLVSWALFSATLLLVLASFFLTFVPAALVRWGTDELLETVLAMSPSMSLQGVLGGGRADVGNAQVGSETDGDVTTSVPARAGIAGSPSSAAGHLQMVSGSVAFHAHCLASVADSTSPSNAETAGAAVPRAPHALSNAGIALATFSAAGVPGGAPEPQAALPSVLAGHQVRRRSSGGASGAYDLTAGSAGERGDGEVAPVAAQLRDRPATAAVRQGLHALRMARQASMLSLALGGRVPGGGGGGGGMPMHDPRFVSDLSGGAQTLAGSLHSGASVPAPLLVTGAVSIQAAPAAGGMAVLAAQGRISAAPDDASERSSPPQHLPWRHGFASSDSARAAPASAQRARAGGGGGAAAPVAGASPLRAVTQAPGVCEVAVQVPLEPAHRSTSAPDAVPNSVIARLGGDAVAFPGGAEQAGSNLLDTPFAASERASLGSGSTPERPMMCLDMQSDVTSATDAGGVAPGQARPLPELLPSPPGGPAQLFMDSGMLTPASEALTQVLPGRRAEQLREAARAGRRQLGMPPTRSALLGMDDALTQVESLRSAGSLHLGDEQDDIERWRALVGKAPLLSQALLLAESETQLYSHHAALAWRLRFSGRSHFRVAGVDITFRLITRSAYLLATLVTFALQRAAQSA